MKPVIIIAIAFVFVVIAAALLMNPTSTEKTISVSFDADKVPTGLTDIIPSETESKDMKSIDDISIDPKYTQEEIDAGWTTEMGIYFPTFDELGEGWEAKSEPPYSSPHYTLKDNSKTKSEDYLIIKSIMGMVLTYLILGVIISVGTILLRYYLSERKKQPRNDKSKSYGSTDNHYR